ncbi:MAG TPA: helix-turn-helix domain-containing protein, partial [Thermoplasmata archaeon]|nr:helix-turn-helix domain-containing protein [Thermoplasmata archaeon]
IGSYRGSQDLTARQEQAVGTAFMLGYFDYPRRAQLKDVAKSLGVSRTTAMENLRRGMRKLASRRQAEVGIVRAPPRPGDLPPSRPGDFGAHQKAPNAGATGR